VLKIYGGRGVFVGTTFQASGMWSSGMYDKDYQLHYAADRRYGSIDLRDMSNIVISGESCVFFQDCFRITILLLY
jgi:hypothetical protein